MEKKTQQIFSRQGSNKSLQQTDQVRKNNNDIQSTKPKNSARRRENKNASTKFETARQTGKKFSTEKRSKPRIFEHRNYVETNSPSTSLSLNDAAAGSEGSIDFNNVELNSIYNRGSKKQNLNHLLNFNYVTLDDSHNVYRRLGDRNTGNYKNCNKRRTKYNKEQYLQANFQFVINSSVDQSIVTCSPDTLIDWNLIEQIHIRTTEEPQCPICLFPPIAAKLTKCGHVYCWPCILHYLSLTDKSWRKCPICYEAVHPTDLKSTAIIQQRNFNVGDNITFQLMRRKKGSIVIEKALGETSDGMPPISDADNIQMFSKFLKLDLEEILDIIEREKHELLFEQDRNCPEFVFIHQALDLLEQRKCELLRSSVSPKSYSTVGDSEVFEKDNEKFYYFYQSNDAQNIFLHPLNIKMLQTMYSSLSNAPNIIEGRIVQKESQSMDEILRKKFTCLGHLPLTCQFEIVEIDIKSLVSKEVADIFEDEILLREKVRVKRAREEKKREKHINEIYDRQMGKLIAQNANIDINSDLQFPVCGIDESSSSNSFSVSSPRDGAGASFSNVTATTKKEFWPALDKPSQFKNFSELSCTVKPTANLPRPLLEEPNSEDEDQFFPTLHSIGDVLSEALQVKQAIEGNSGLNKKSKRNAKPKIIFASGLNYKGN